MSGNFSQWVEQQKEGGKGAEDSQGFLLGQLNQVQDSLSTQYQDLAGVLPDANGYTGYEFRQRMTNAIYLLLASIGFAALAIFVGLPTIVLKPGKFVFCISMCTLCAICSVVVLQRPSVYIASLVEGGLATSLPIILLLFSILWTLYVAIFVHKYVYLVLAGGVQSLMIFYYLSSFIPGGKQGLILLLKSGFTIINGMLVPLKIYIRQTFS